VGGPGDFLLLEAVLGDPAMTEQIGRPENPEKLAKRQAPLPKARLLSVQDRRRRFGRGGRLHRLLGAGVAGEDGLRDRIVDIA
jgi:hypothetical protein